MILWAYLSAALVLAPHPIPRVVGIHVHWTAPGDDSLSGTASRYDLRCSLSAPDTASDSARAGWWSRALVMSGLPTPASAGTQQNCFGVLRQGFGTGLTYYFVLRASDEAGNLSGWSNVLRVRLAGPSAVRDLSSDPRRR